jgi:hypothetical protein
MAMRIPYAFLCDAAAQHNGQVDATGIYLGLAAPQLPHDHKLVLVAMLELDDSDEGAGRMITIRLLDAQGNLGGSFPYLFGVPENMPGEKRVAYITRPVGLTFRKYGVYRFVLDVDGVEQWTISLPVSPKPEYETRHFGPRG